MILFDWKVWALWIATEPVTWAALAFAALCVVGVKLVKAALR